ncbi:MAG: hypothetical protein HQ567_23760, partial [Candidatus Nealsonbacteria bacterium]|nr:hypothetical protein [Candidatus Nealsonbacteria bacterium]
ALQDAASVAGILITTEAAVADAPKKGSGGGAGGGMGGGGMGGGMFNVPRNLLPQVPAGGFRAFSVKDDLAAAAKTTEEKPIPVETLKKGDADVVWQKYFASHNPSRPAVREAVRRIKEDKKDDNRFDHVIGLINAALRNGHNQSWMYEVLVLAMIADDRPSQEIERAVMSAVDLMTNTADLMYIGVYLTKLGLDERALQVFHQVAEMAPGWPEPYMHGLKVAQRLSDLEGTKWATLGILRQAWTKDETLVWKTGLYVAKATLQRLHKEGRKAEAEKFEAALNEAVRRDILVKVSWLGEADVDLLAEEPSGSVCSLRNARSSAGGVMVGDSYSNLGSDAQESYCETYVCPKGFDGTYRILVRRVWGKVTSGRVKVEVFKHFRGKSQERICKYVSLNDDEAMVVFDLKNGRRIEPIEDQKVANAAIGQIAVSRQVLAQRLAAAADPRVASSMYAARERPFVAGQVPFRRGGAVGYQPVIITLPEGTNMIATAVISADRRYVRITAAPLFSGIAEVNTFNTATGEGDGGEGTGGEGYSGVFNGGGEDDGGGDAEQF